MRLHRFLIDQEIGENEEISISNSDLIHQWKNVFRFTTGTQLILFDDSGMEYMAIIERLSNLGAKVRIVNVSDKSKVSWPDFTLLAALLKKDNFEWVIEKATELGVSQIVPLISDRSEKKGLNMERAKKIIKEASEQSGRVKLPRLKEPTALEDLLTSIKLGDKEKIKYFSTDPKGTLKFHDLLKEKKIQEIGGFIGPEGGWSERELELFKLKKIPVYNLGSQILRAETACIAVSTLLLL